MLATTLLLVYKLAPSSPRFSAAVLTVHLLLFLLAAFQVASARQERDHVQAHVLGTLFAEMHERIFLGDDRVRFTYFAESPYRRGVIVPWYRYSKGATDPIQEALKSSACYRPGEGITGQAWVRPGELFLAHLPVFQSEDEFRTYYSEVLGVNREVVANLSEYMQRTRAILAFGFLGHRGDVRGVLSLDIQAPVSINGDQVTVADLDLDSNTMFLILSSIGNLVRAFEKA